MLDIDLFLEIGIYLKFVIFVIGVFVLFVIKILVVLVDFIIVLFWILLIEVFIIGLCYLLFVMRKCFVLLNCGFY